MERRIIAVMSWVIFLFWVYSRNRFTREEHREDRSREIRNDPEYIAWQEELAKELEEDPELKEYIDMVKFEIALEEIQERKEES